MPGSKPATAGWLATRIEALLAHYWRDGDELTGEAVLSDFMAALRSRPQHAVAWACTEWLNTRPRLRPRPGDVAALADEWVAAAAEDARRSALGPEGFREDQERMIQWAVDTGRLGRADAVEAVKRQDGAAFPDWLPESDAHRALWVIRKHPAFVVREEVEAPRRRRGRT